MISYRSCPFPCSSLCMYVLYTWLTLSSAIHASHIFILVVFVAKLVYKTDESSENPDE